MAMNLKRTRGFTLIELMTVVVIVAVLAAIALPSYRNQVIKANRSAAQQFMQDAAIREQQVLLDLRGYVAVAVNADFPNAPTAGSPGLNITVPSNTSPNYNFRVDQVNNAATPPTFRVYATAIGSQATDGDLQLDYTGAKTPVNKW